MYIVHSLFLRRHYHVLSSSAICYRMWLPGGYFAHASFADLHGRDGAHEDHRDHEDHG